MLAHAARDHCPWRVIWVARRRLWSRWDQSLVIVQPSTVIGWHKAGLRAYWRWKSRPKGGRPKIAPEVRKLIRQMWLTNPTWGRPRIRAELAKLGIDVSESTVRKYRPKMRKPPSQTWRTFLENHLDCTVGMDFFVVVTVTFRLLYGFVIVSHDNQAVLDTSLDAALARLFRGFDGGIGDRITDSSLDTGTDVPAGSTGDDATSGDPAGPASDDPAALVAEAERLYLEAQRLLQAGDLGGYQAKLDEVGVILGQLSDLLGG